MHSVDCLTRSWSHLPSFIHSHTNTDLVQARTTHSTSEVDKHEKGTIFFQGVRIIYALCFLFLFPFWQFIGDYCEYDLILNH